MKPMTLTQKILADHAGLDYVVPGQLIEASLDIVLGNDITAPVAIDELNTHGMNKIFNKDKIVLVMDHFTPNKDIKAATQVKQVREFAKSHNITHFYDVGDMGIEHALLPEKGIVGPGDCIIGADSHTCTYGALGAFSTGVGSTDMAAGMYSGKAWFKVPDAIKVNLTGKLPKFVTGKDVVLHLIGEISTDGALYQSLEFIGEGAKSLTISDRLTICNMAIEAGAKNGIFQVDDVTLDFVKDRFAREMKIYEADDGAEYSRVVNIDLSKLELTVAFPHSPDNTRKVSEAAHIKIDQAFIGSCTNGFLPDLRAAAEILKGKKIAKDVRCIVVPSTQQIYLDAIKEGLVEIFINAGAVVSTPTCGACLGGHMGVLAAGERAISTTNRNFVGRMGHVESEVYLASPAVAAASAITGYITCPSKV